MGWWALGAAAALQLVAGVLRARAWWHVIRDSSPEAAGLRYRDVVVAHLGGVGWNGVLPAHGGDAVKLVIVSRKAPRLRLTTIAATLVPSALVEAVITALLLTAVFAAGVMSLDVLSSALPPAGTILVLTAVLGLVLFAVVLLRRRLEALLDSVRAGLSLLRRPRLLASRVLPWLAAGRVVRLLAFALVLTAAGVPFGILPALALMALQGATPSAGAAATAARIALIAAVLSGTGAADVPATKVAEALAAAYGVTLVVNLVVSGLVLAVLLRTASPRRILAYGRSAVQRVGRAQRPWAVGSAGTLVSRR